MVEAADKTALQGAARGVRRQRARRPFLTWEGGLSAVGVALAAASGAFASYMISDPDRQPRFSGSEYLTVFAKLAHGGSGPTRTPGTFKGADVDDFATGAIPDIVTPPGSDPSISGPKAPLKGYRLRLVFRGRALIETPDGPLEVRPGSLLPNGDRVAAIEKRDGKWVVITSRGIIVEPAG